MSTRTTRSKTKQSSETPASTSTPVPKISKTNSKSHDVDIQSGKENKTVKGTAAGKSAQSKGSTGKGRAMSTVSADKPFCTCKKGDDGTPMIYCTECKDWLHFSCVDLDETDAEDISVYVCPPCSEKTGLHPLMSWEEPDESEPPPKKSGPTSVASKPRPRQKSKTPKAAPPTLPEVKPVVERTPEPVEPPSASEDSGDDDDDDYVVDTKSKGGRGKRGPRRVSYHSESELSDLSDAPTTSRLRKASSPTLKRVARRDSDGAQHPAKKAKPLDSSDDPTRKYCLGKLEAVFRDIFLRYPHVRSKVEVDDEVPRMEEKGKDDVTEEEKDAILQDSKQFADDLEKCVFEIYSEPDKHGKSAAAAKYKDRFRMLQFNLSKVDRVVLHRRIASGHITPKEISVMSSTDLANEELKQSIKSAEQESLEQSILTKSTAPRTKITHKGLEDIEDINGRNTREHERRQLEEEERMERERVARLRAVQPRQRTMSVSVPPESPITPASESWGAPPPVPAHALDVPMESPPSRPPLFLNTSSEVVVPEPELNLADLINIDDEPGSAQEPAPPADLPQPASPPEANPVDAPTILRSPTGISPFAIQRAPSPSTPVQPTTPRAPAFDLNSLWSLSSVAAGNPPSTSVEEELTAKPQPGEQKDVVMESEPIAANDQDFDMFLEEKEIETPESAQAAFDALPQVWNGKINMPLDSAIPQETPVVGRQLGGKAIDVSSGRWRTLFPSDSLRIDGRVPVENSAKFLLQMRMNSAKELVAVAFSSAPGADDSGFKFLSEFLINKGRHGLVFPWGNRPKEYHPGKELYIIPLIASDPLPDYIELLDDLRLPKLRTTNYLLGIWILNKGRLASPPPPPPPQQASVPVPLSSHNHTIRSPAPVPTPPIQAPMPPTNAVNHLVNPSIASIAATLPIDQNALVAELASLTPEQLAFVTQALARSNTVPPVPAAPVALPAGTSSSTIPLPLPLPVPLPMPIPTDRSWGNQSSGYGSAIAMPAPPHSNQFPGMGTNRRGSGDFGGDFGNGNSRGRDNRGGRGGRNRGRGRGDDLQFHNAPGPVDSGWPRKNAAQQRKW